MKTKSGNGSTKTIWLTQGKIGRIPKYELSCETKTLISSLSFMTVKDLRQLQSTWSKMVRSHPVIQKCSSIQPNQPNCSALLRTKFNIHMQPGDRITRFIRVVCLAKTSFMWYIGFTGGCRRWRTHRYRPDQ